MPPPALAGTTGGRDMRGRTNEEGKEEAVRGENEWGEERGSDEREEWMRRGRERDKRRRMNVE